MSGKMLKSSSESSMSSDDVTFVITDVRSLGNTDDKSSSRNSRQRKQDQPRKRLQVNSTGSQHRQESWKGSSGKFDRRCDGEKNIVPRDDLQNAQASSSSHSLIARSVSRNGQSSETRRLKKGKKSAPRYLEPLDPVPSTSHGNQQNVINDVDDPSAGFDIDCSPYNGGGLNNTDDTKGILSGSSSEGAPVHVQAGRSRRTVSPYPFKLKLNLKKYNQDEWFIDNSSSQDAWDDSEAYTNTNRMNAGATPAFNRPTHDVRYWEEEPHCSWQNPDRSAIEGSMEDLHLNERFVTVINGNAAGNLKPCLKKKADEEMRRSRNVSWDDENNEFDTAVDYSEDLDKCNDDEENEDERNVTDIGKDKKCSVSSHQTDSISSHFPAENERCPIKTPVNSIEETKSLESDVEDDDAVIEGPPSSSASEESSTIIQNAALKCNIMVEIKVPDKDDVEYRGATPVVENWSDDAISRARLLTDEQKRRIIEEHREELGQIRRYDDPHLSRADRIRLLWEDCARKEHLLEKLRPNAACGHGTSTNVNLGRYNHYLY